MSLYDKLGGQDSIGKVVDNFYDKVLSDDTVNHFFKDTDMDKQRRHQTMFISWAVGGPNQYSGLSMEKAHEGMNIQPEHFQAIANHLVASLKDFNVGEDEINQVVEKLLTLKDAILYK